MNTFPQFIYGTAWKQAATSQLVEMAISVGFTAIDTANQPRHYSESLVGDALFELRKKGHTRDKFYIQSKFTTPDGHDHRIPYNPAASIAEQVASSFAGSLEHLHTDYLDAYLLHGPYTRPGLVDEDWQVWHALETLYAAGKTKMIGVSNVNLQQLQALVSGASIKPQIVQNRCYANKGWDEAVRTYCRANQIIYQGFSLLTANTHLLEQETVRTLALKYQKTPAQILFRLAIQLGIVPLTGSSNELHLQQDLAVTTFELSSQEVAEIFECGVGLYPK